MSHSPVEQAEFAQAKDPESEYRQSIARLNELLRGNGSLSGREKNCVFLNTRGGRFATISGVSGIDFADDARSHALVDWDRDGDLDVWTANRTAPQLRFLRNDANRAGTSVAIRLVGKTCNRDAIGARVFVATENDSAAARTRTLRAGEGFLSQSSKWLHFGLGSGAKIASISVLWPGANAAETFRGMDGAGRFVLVQGNGLAAVDSASPLADTLEPAPAAVAERAEGFRARLAAQWYLPDLTYVDFAGERNPIPSANQEFTLVNLWATWCQPCMAELGELARNEQALRNAGVEVVALAVEEATRSVASSDSAASPTSVLDGLGYTMSSGTASQEVIASIELMANLPFRARAKLVVPTSALVDRRGRVVSVYRGRASVGRVLDDVADFRRSGDDALGFVAPFSGRWIREPRLGTPLNLAVALMDRGKVGLVASLVDRHDAAMRRDREYPKLLVWLADTLIETDEHRRALEYYERALGVDPDNVLVMNNLAWRLAAHKDHGIRDGGRAVRWARRAAEATNGADPNVLDTLAAALAQNGEFEKATRTAKRAIELANRRGDAALANKLKARLAIYERRQSLP